jgi:hypothetical protein
MEVISTAAIGHPLETTSNIVTPGQSACILVTVILIVVALHHPEAHGTGSKAEGLLVRRAAETQDDPRGVNITEALGKWKVVVCERAAVGRSSFSCSCDCTCTCTWPAAGSHLKAKVGHVSAKFGMTESARRTATGRFSGVGKSPAVQSTSKRGKLATLVVIHGQDLSGESILVMNDERLAILGPLDDGRGRRINNIHENLGE